MKNTKNTYRARFQFLLALTLALVLDALLVGTHMGGRVPAVALELLARLILLLATVLGLVVHVVVRGDTCLGIPFVSIFLGDNLL